MTSTDARLDRLRGSTQPVSHTARTVAALTANPGCARRSLMDAAGVDKGGVATHVGFPQRSGASQSPFALARGAIFEAQVKANGAADLVRLLRDRLGLNLPEVSYSDLESVGGNIEREVRYQRTRALLRRAVRHPDEAGTLYDHPLLKLQVGGRLAYLEPTSSRSRYGQVPRDRDQVVRGHRRPGRRGERSRRRHTVSCLHPGTAGSAHRRVASCRLCVHRRHPGHTQGFLPQATATFIDVRKQVSILRRQLARMTRIDVLVGELPEGLTFDLVPEPDGSLQPPA